MVSRISLVLSTLLKNYDKNIFNVPLKFYMRSKYHLAAVSSVGPSHKESVSESNESIQVSKYIQPLVDCSVDQILTIVDKKTLSVNESVSLLKALRIHILFKGTNPAVFREDSRFTDLCESFMEICDGIEPNLLISGLRSLLEIGVPSNSKCVIYAEQNIINHVNKFSTFNLIGCLYFHHKFQETDLQKTVVSLLIETLLQKTSEINSSAEILMLVNILPLFDKEGRNKLEQNVIKFCPTLSLNEICKIFITFANNTYRNTFLLNTLSFHLQNKSEKPNIKEIIDILYAFKKLNFYDGKLLTYLLEDHSSEILESEHPSVICGILSVCGHLRWKQKDILDACGEWIMKRIDTCRTRELVAYILTTAALNYVSPRSQEILKTIFSKLSCGKVDSSNVWLDVIWSLAAVDIVDKQSLQHVLSTDFYKSLTDGKGPTSIINQIKLLNLKAVLKLYHPECIFSCDLHLEPVKVPQSSVNDGNRKIVISSLSNFVRGEKFLCTCQSTEMGIYIDAEFILDKNMRPLSLLECGILSKATAVTKELATGSKRISLLILFHKDYTMKFESITGSTALAIRLLSAQGYTVVLIPFHEFMRCSTELKRTQFLWKKITDSIRV